MGIVHAEREIKLSSADVRYAHITFFTRYYNQPTHCLELGKQYSGEYFELVGDDVKGLRDFLNSLELD